MAAVIETIELKKHYGTHEAVRGVNLSVKLVLCVLFSVRTARERARQSRCCWE